MAEDPRAQRSGPPKTERYPSVRQDDAVERTGRTEEVTGEDPSFDPAADAPTPGNRDIAGGGSAPPASNEGKLGAAGDPSEGKR
jgi:hypothetical protein